MMMLIDIFVSFILCIPFLIVCLISNKINLKRQYRGSQFSMPIIATFYSLIIGCNLSRLASFLYNLFSTIAKACQNLPLIGRFLSGMFASLAHNFMSGFAAQLILNIAIFIIFFIVKKICLFFLMPESNTPHIKPQDHFYIKSNNTSILMKKYVHLRGFMCCLYIGCIVLALISTMMSIMLHDRVLFLYPYIPVFAVIIIGEIYHFLNGYSFDEGNNPGEEENKRNVGPDYDRLLRILKSVFGDRLSYKTIIPGDYSEKKEHQWNQDINEDDYMDNIVGQYFQALQDSGEELCPDYVIAAKKLMNQQSVLMYNPFYHDMTDYLMLPILHEMLNHHSCLIVCGRTTDEEDIIDWLKTGIEEVTNLPKLWKMSVINEYSASENPDIGIIQFSNLYRMDILKSNRSFFEKTRFIILLEPSNLLGTGQIGLRNIIQLCEDKNKKLTYCILDRNADGLVDALSHVLRQSITEVVATPVSKSPLCQMFWKAEGPGMQNRVLPRVSHYLGIGTEIACRAMYEGVEYIEWFSGSKMPLVDLKWNVEQYYAPICKYVHLPKEQNELSQRIHFNQFLWHANLQDEAFIFVEDEFCNLFEMARVFSGRFRTKGFINILSESYMLREYMCDSHILFNNDAKAIPTIVPDYARTLRNFVIRTIMYMSVMPLEESQLSNELSLHGCDSKNPYNTLCELIERYTGIQEFHVQTIRDYVVVGGRKYSRFSYQIDKALVDLVFDAELRSAYYVVENEQLQVHQMGNRLMGHIEQAILPGQFFCYDGKYYQAKSISAKTGIVVRRAADHLNGRYYYRQNRKYTIDIHSYNDDVRYLRDIRIKFVNANIDVATSGYLEMKARQLLKSSAIVKLEKARKRQIVNKEILKLTFSNTSEQMRFTLCVLLNELFQTVYPTECIYLAVVPASVPEEIRNNEDYASYINAVVSDFSCKEKDESIYIIEDSCIDLGLLISIERNIQRYLEILFDYLDWFFVSNKINQTNNVNNVNADQIAMEDVDGEDEEYIADASQDAEDQDSDEAYGEEKSDDKIKNDQFLYYGYDQVPEWLDLSAVYDYLKEHRYDESNIHQSRKHTPEFDEDSTYDPKQPGIHYCDYCGKPLKAGEYEVLKDGRERCMECGKDAIRTRKQFKAVFQETMSEMERIFGIHFNEEIKVRMVNAKKVNDGFNEPFVPTPGFDVRVLGYAQNVKPMKLLVEYGMPLWKMKSTLVHELTHIWQFMNWTTIPQTNENVELYEGMAVWTEIQYYVAMGKIEEAIRYKRNREVDPSVYGTGMLKYIQKYPIELTSDLVDKTTPFNTMPPL